MNSKQRLDAFVSGKPTDRRPNLTIVGSVVTRYTGIDIATYSKDYHLMVDSAIAAAHDLDLDFIQIASDLVLDAEAYGSEVAYYPDKLPTIIRPALSDITEVSRLKPLDIESAPRLKAMVDATAYALEKEPDIWPMTLCVGPATVAGNTRGVEHFLFDLADEPEACAELLNIATETTCRMIRALADVGARYAYIADPVASLLSASMYEELILPLHQKIFGLMNQLHITGRLHMCGNTLHILPFSSTSGAKIIDIDHAVPYADALAAVSGRCILNGNIDPVADVADCDAAHTKQAILDAAADADYAPNALFMPGCELPAQTPLENIRAIHQAICQIR